MTVHCRSIVSSSPYCNDNDKTLGQENKGRLKICVNKSLQHELHSIGLIEANFQVPTLFHTE